MDILKALGDNIIPLFGILIGLVAIVTSAIIRYKRLEMGVDKNGNPIGGSKQIKELEERVEELVKYSNHLENRVEELDAKLKQLGPGQRV